MNNQCLFCKLFIRYLEEDISTSSAGIGGTATGLVGNSDSYAPGDARIPHSLFGGRIFRRGKNTRKKKKSRSRKKSR